MARKIIPTAPGTGKPINEGFQDINDNFTENYADITNLGETKADTTDVDAKDAQVLLDAQAHADAAAAQALVDAQAYTDAEMGDIPNIVSFKADTTYVNSQDAQTLADAQAYTDAELGNIPELVSFKADITYVDAQDAQTLADAQAYTDAELGEIPTLINTKADITYVDNEISNIELPGIVEETVVGKNKFNKANVTAFKAIDNSTGAVVDNNWAYISGLIPVKPDTFYYLSGRHEASSALGIRVLKVGDSTTGHKVLSVSGNVFTNYNLPNIDGTSIVIDGPFKTPSDAEFIQFNYAWSSSFYGQGDNVMLEEVGSFYPNDFTPSPVEAYTETVIKYVTSDYLPVDLETKAGSAVLYQTLKESLSVEIAKKNFKSTLTSGKNLFNKDDIQIAHYMDVTNGYVYIYTGGLNTSNRYSTSKKIPIKPNTYYYLSGRSGAATNMRAIACFVEGSTVPRKVLSSGTHTEAPTFGLPNSTGTGDSTVGRFYTPGNVDYIQFTTSSNGSNPLSTIMLEEVSTSTSPSTTYEPFTYNNILNYESLPSDVAKISEVEETVFTYSPIVEDTGEKQLVSSNIFNPELILNGFYISDSSGSVFSSGNSIVSDFIKIKPNTYYYLSGLESNSRINNIAAYATNKTTKYKVLGAVSGTAFSGDWGIPNENATDDVDNGSFLTPPNAEYIQFGIAYQGIGDPNTVMLEEIGETYTPGYTPLPFEPYLLRSINKVAMISIPDEVETVMGAQEKVDAAKLPMLPDTVKLQAGGNNKFDKDSMVLPLQHLHSSTATIVHNSTSGMTSLIPVKESTFYSLTGRNTAGYNDLKTIVVYKNGDTTTPHKVLAVNDVEYASNYMLPNSLGTGAVPNGPFKTPEGAEFIQFTYRVQSNGTPDTLMLEEIGETYPSGHTPLPYESYVTIPVEVISMDLLPTEVQTISGSQAQVDIVDNKIKSFTERKLSINLFKGEIINGEFFIQTNGSLIQQTDFRLSTKIPVKPNTYYYLSGRNQFNSSTRGIRVYKNNEYPHPVLPAIEGNAWTIYNLPNEDGTNSANNGPFKTPEGAEYVQFTASPSGDAGFSEVMLYEIGETYTPGYTPLPYEKYGDLLEVKKTALPSDIAYGYLPKFVDDLYESEPLTKNLFNGETVNGGLDTNGNIVGLGGYELTTLIPVKPNTFYGISREVAMSSTTARFFEKTNIITQQKVLTVDGEELPNYSILNSTGNNNGFNSFFLTPNKEGYVQFSVKTSSGDPDTTMFVEIGETIPEDFTFGAFEPYSLVPKNVITKDELPSEIMYNNDESGISREVVSTSKNIFDSSNIIGNGYINDSGTITEHSTSYYSGRVPVKPNTYYYLSGRANSLGVYPIRVEKSDGTYVKTLRLDGTEGNNFYLQLPNGNSVADGPFLTPDDAEFVEFTVKWASTGDVSTIMLEEVGDVYPEDFTPSTYEAFAPLNVFKISKNILPRTTLYSDTVEEVLGLDNFMQADNYFTEVGVGKNKYSGRVIGSTYIEPYNGMIYSAGDTTYISEKVPVLPNTLYNISGRNTAQANNGALICYKKDGTVVKALQPDGSDLWYYSIYDGSNMYNYGYNGLFKTPEDVEFIQFGISYAGIGGPAEDIMLELVGAAVPTGFTPAPLEAYIPGEVLKSEFTPMSAETINGAADKAITAETNAKTYADNKIEAASEKTLRDAKKYADSLHPETFNTKDEFEWNEEEFQIFTLTYLPVKIYNVIVNGQILMTDEYNVDEELGTVEILNDLDEGDGIQVAYEGRLRIDFGPDELIVKFRVPSDDLYVALPIGKEMYTRYYEPLDNQPAVNNITVDWGDGAIEDFDEAFFDDYSQPLHEYAEAGDYTITISGQCEVFDLYNWYWYGSEYKLIEVISWGNTGLKQLSLGDARFLEKLPEGVSPHFESLISIQGMFYNTYVLQDTFPEGLFFNAINLKDVSEFCPWGSTMVNFPANIFENSPLIENADGAFNEALITEIPAGIFKNKSMLKSLDWAFMGCLSLTSIPDDFLEGCTAMEILNSTFSDCTAITGIPSNFFDDMPNLTDIGWVFDDCSAATGPAPEIWLRNPEIIQHQNAFYNCTNLSNYSDIPNDYKGL